MQNRKIKRSTICELMSTIAPINHVLRARNDIVGSMVTVALVLGCLSVMRLILAHS